MIIRTVSLKLKSKFKGIAVHIVLVNTNITKCDQKSLNKAAYINLRAFVNAVRTKGRTSQNHGRATGIARHKIIPISEIKKNIQ